MIRPASLLVLLLLVAAPPAGAQERPFGTLREQADVRQEWLRLRLERVLPRLMREHDVAMWIIPMREYNEDPVFRALVSPTTQAARRRTIYVFCDRGAERGVERIAIGGTSQGGLYRVVRDPGAQLGTAGATQRFAEPFGPAQWQLLPPIVEACDPRTIAVNVSHTHAFSDGLTAGEWEQLREALPPRYRERVVRRELLPLQYLEERLPEMLPVYVEMQRAGARDHRRGVLGAGDRGGGDADAGRGLVDAPARQRPRARRLVPALRQRAAPRRRDG
jgi:hypothetical protein